VCVSDCCLSRIVVHVPWLCEWLLLISNCSSCPVIVWVIAVYLELYHSHNHETWTTIRDKQQSLTHSQVMNYNSRLTAITHTLTGHELQFEINSNHSHTHATWTTIQDKQQSLTHSRDCCLSQIAVHVPWVCEWLLLISNCCSCPVSVWMIAVYLEL
jgi:hypothetical protein